MGLIGLALKNIRGNIFRSTAIFSAVLAISGLLLVVTLIIAGAQNSLNSGLQRLGADIIVVPAGTESQVENALLMGKPTNVWMPSTNLQAVANIPGVQSVSPQQYLGSLYGASCCSASEMFIVVFDPKTDLTISPWLEKNLGRPLEKREVIGGTFVFVTPGENFIKLYGYDLTLKGNLSPTGTGIDQTLFMTTDTARAVAQSSLTTAVQPLAFDPNQISTIMVKVSPNSDAHAVALQIMLNTKGMVAIESPNLFGAFRNQMNGLLWGFFAITIIVWAVAMVLIGILFSMAANERRRDMAVLRAVGATRSFILRSVLSEAIILALAGAVSGIVLATSGLYVLRNFIAGSMKLPFLFPSLSAFIGFFIAGVALAIATVMLAALMPAVRLSRQELAIAMRD